MKKTKIYSDIKINEAQITVLTKKGDIIWKPVNIRQC